MMSGQHVGGTTVPAAPLHRSGRGVPDQLVKSFTARSPFKRSEFSQMMIDLLAVCAAVGLVCVTGVGIAFAFFVLMFVKI